MYIHAIYKIREFLSYKGFDLIKVYFSVHYSACVNCYHYCFNAKLFQETVPVAPAVRFYYGVRCNDVANMLQRHILQCPPVKRYSRLCVKWSPTGG